MVDLDTLKELVVESTARIVLVVLDGLGGLPLEPGGPDTLPEDAPYPGGRWHGLMYRGGGQTELETARTPNLDTLAARSSLGLATLVAPGLTPGSGPGHLALFGYDPLQWLIGRGVLEALGIGFDLHDSDVAARGNFCTIDAHGLVTDRRAGRIATELNVELCQQLRTIQVSGAQVLVEPVKEHRFVVVFRGEGLSDQLSETDPQQLGVPPKPVQALAPTAGPTARLVNDFLAQARHVLAAHYPANMVLLRGFAKHPNLPTFAQLYGLHPACIAAYPMYKGLAKLAGMDILPVPARDEAHGPTIAEEFATLAANWQRYDFFFLHVKQTDSAGEDGDFARKVSVIEEVDRHIPELLALNPDVVVVTGDHSTPALLKMHSWHPVPYLLYSRYCRPDGIAEFGERACARGSLGNFAAAHGLRLMLANALRLTKYGA